MDQKRGYALLKVPSLLLSLYVEYSFVKEHRQFFQELRDAVSFIAPSRYRGISREPLSPLSSFDTDILKEFEVTGGDMRTNYRARRRFLEIVGDNSCFADYDEDLLPDFTVAQEVHSLLDNPDEYEIVSVTRAPLEPNIKSLGFDIGYWGGDHFSIICDSVVMPMWHLPDPADFEELAEALRGLNEHGLFQTHVEAEEFRSYYLTKSWAETETVDAEFCIIQIGLPATI